MSKTPIEFLVFCLMGALLFGIQAQAQAVAPQHLKVVKTAMEQPAKPAEEPTTLLPQTAFITNNTALDANTGTAPRNLGVTKPTERIPRFWMNPALYGRYPWVPF